MPKVLPMKPGVEEDAEDRVRILIQIEMMKRGIGNRELAILLNDVGVKENERNLRNKIARGSFSAAFFLLALKAMGCETISLEGWENAMSPEDKAEIRKAVGELQSLIASSPAPTVAKRKR